MTIAPAGMLPPRVVDPCMWKVPLAAVLLLRVEFTRIGEPLSAPPFKLNVKEVKASAVLSVPPFRLNVPELKAPDPAFTLMTPDAALLNVPEVIISVELVPAVESSRISPELVKPLAAAVRVA